ncbi:BA14K family protein [Pararhizobium sp. O133]|uniref:BA14K family protein n=1 Tax=Pararhizobium sp. O133 TaxID=3449278 RepID=UPI003F68915C
MPRLTEILTTLAMTGLLLIVTQVSASAFHLQPSSGAVPSSTASFAEGSNPENEASVPLLSLLDVQHIRWCAARYASYHPTDNTYASRSGHRLVCRSPG